MFVVRIQGRDIFGFSASFGLTAAGEQWLDDFVAKDNKRGHGVLGGHPKTGQSWSLQNRPMGTSQDKS
jgi:hypothetical protein